MWLPIMLKWLRKAFSVRVGGMSSILQNFLAPVQTLFKSSHAINKLPIYFKTLSLLLWYAKWMFPSTLLAQQMQSWSTSLLFHYLPLTKDWNYRICHKVTQKKMGDSTFISQNLNPLMDGLVSSVSTFISLRLGLFSWEVDWSFWYEAVYSLALLWSCGMLSEDSNIPLEVLSTAINSSL